MAESIPSTNNAVRMSLENFRARQQAGEPAIVLDVRNPKEWDRGDAKIPGALRAPIPNSGSIRAGPGIASSWPTEPDRRKRTAPVWRSSSENRASRKPMPCSVVSRPGKRPAIRSSRRPCRHRERSRISGHDLWVARRACDLPSIGFGLLGSGRREIPSEPARIPTSWAHARRNVAAPIHPAAQ